jgi:uncharacterized membrane protein
MTKKQALLAAAVAGIVSAGAMAAPPVVQAGKDKKASDGAHKCGGTGKCGGASQDVNCYGVNKCKGAGKCGGEGTSCAGTNSCKGKGWLPMPKDSCLAIEGGSLTPPKG